MSILINVLTMDNYVRKQPVAWEEYKVLVLTNKVRNEERNE